MGIINRSLDASEQEHVYTGRIEDTVTSGVDSLGIVAAFPGTVTANIVDVVGVSGSPTAQLGVKRQVAAGETLIPLGGALALAASSTSGPQSYTFSTSTLNAGDRLYVTHAGANSAVDQLTVSLVIKATQDIRKNDY